jgi:phage shock protein A
MAEAEATALVELHAGTDDDLEATLAAGEDQRRIEAELIAIKQAPRPQP